VNLILFDSAEIDRPLPRTDRRTAHLLKVLRCGPGDCFDAGIINGPRGRAKIEAVTDACLAFSFVAQIEPPPTEPVTLLVGLPRPQTARDILRDATTLGVAALHFVLTEKGEPSYAQSTLWSTGEWRRHLIAGAEQAFATAVPAVTWGQSLTGVTAALKAPARLALDNYESPSSLREWQPPEDRPEVALAIGSERGWSTAERALLRAQGFHFHHLGPRALRTETACTAALAIVRTKLGLM
jgi:RsmE family RNA methyltransferase